MKKEDYNNIVSNFKENEFLKRRIEEGVLKGESVKKNSKRKMVLVVSTILLAIIIIPVVGIKTTINKNTSSKDTTNSYLTTEDSIKSNNSGNEELNSSSKDRPNKMSFLKIRITSINEYGFSGKIEEDANRLKSGSEVVIDYDEDLKFDYKNLKENDVVNVGYFEIRESYPMQIKIYSIEKIG